MLPWRGVLLLASIFFSAAFLVLYATFYQTQRQTTTPTNNNNNNNNNKNAQNGVGHPGSVYLQHTSSLVSDPRIYETRSMYEYIDLNADSPGPACWNKDKYDRWKNGTLPIAYMSPQHRQAFDHIFFSIVTGKVNHRKRCDIVMCTYGKQVLRDRFYLHSDGDDDQQQLPLIGNIHTPDGHCDHSCSERKWISGMKHTVPLALSNNDIHWIMIGDDDTFIAPTILGMVASRFDHNKPYLLGSKHYKFDGTHDGVYGGAGLLVSRQLAENILPHLDRCDSYQGISQSDLFLSHCMTELGNAINLDLHEFTSQAPRFYFDQPDNTVEYVRLGWQPSASFHYVKPWQEYYYLYMLYQAFSWEGAPQYTHYQHQHHLHTEKP